MASEFRVGDLVWGKIESRLWWPGQIYDESLADSSVMQTKTKGCLLVSFFGDDTYSWLHPKNLLPYEPHFLSKSKQSKSAAFKKAVEFAIDEVKAREEAAFSCQCQKPDDSYEFPVDQVERFRRELNPAEMVSFLHKLALEPMDLTRDGPFMRNVARFLAYRIEVFAEAGQNCPTYKEAFVGPDGYESSNDHEEALPQEVGLNCPTFKEAFEGPDGYEASNDNEEALPQEVGLNCPTYKEAFKGPDDEASNDRGEALPQGAASTYDFERVEVPAISGKRKGSSSGHSRPLIARGKNKRAKYEKALPKTDCGKASEGHVSRNRPKANQESQDAFLDKEALVFMPSKSSSGIVPTEKGIMDRSVDPPKSRYKGMELASPKGEKANLVEPGAVLHIKFPLQAPLPSTSELKAKFARFGRLNISAMYSSRKSSKCHVGFQRTSDAESARDHLQRHDNMYNRTKVSCYIEGLEVNPSPKSSEPTKFFPNPPHQWSSSSVERASKTEGGRTENYQLAIPPPALPSIPIHPKVSSSQEVFQLANVMDKNHLETSQTAIDISGPFLRLLKEVDKCMEDLKRTQKKH